MKKFPPVDGLVRAACRSIAPRKRLGTFFRLLIPATIGNEFMALGAAAPTGIQRPCVGRRREACCFTAARKRLETLSN
ncbi:MAG: hypothetical protein LBQ54_05750 [Planctomycetaceae bacterium]|nr:hypothetical protein [Planctomycetaceae bacterium]